MLNSFDYVYGVPSLPPAPSAMGRSTYIIYWKNTANL